MSIPDKEALESPGKSITDEGASIPGEGAWDNPAPVEDEPGNSDATGNLPSGENVNGYKGSTSRKLSMREFEVDVGFGIYQVRVIMWNISRVMDFKPPMYSGS